MAGGVTDWISLLIKGLIYAPGVAIGIALGGLVGELTESSAAVGYATAGGSIIGCQLISLWNKLDDINRTLKAKKGD